MHLCSNRKEMVLTPGDEAMMNESKEEKKQHKAKEKQIIINE